MAGNPKRHHYLPQTIQRNFLKDDESQLWWYSREKGIYEQRTPRGIGHARNLYTLDNPETQQRYALENAFSTLESKAAPALLKLQNHEELSQVEHSNISEFVGMQYYRTPTKLKMIDKVTEEGGRFATTAMKDDIAKMTDEQFADFTSKFTARTGKPADAVTKQALLDYLEKGVVSPTNPQNFRLEMLADAGTNLGIKLSKRRWVVLHAASGQEFITSDVALHLTVDGEATKETGFGPGAPGTAITFPFSKDTALMITSEKTATVEHAVANELLITAVNTGLARVSGELYSTNKQLLESLVESGSLANTTFELKFDSEQMEQLARKHFY